MKISHQIEFIDLNLQNGTAYALHLIKKEGSHCIQVQRYFHRSWRMFRGMSLINWFLSTTGITESGPSQAGISL